MRTLFAAFGKWLLLLLFALLALQLAWVTRIALMLAVDPESTAFQRSQFVSIATQGNAGKWRHAWVPYERISNNLKLAVIASEDGSFSEHGGVDWEAMEKAWQRNEKSEARAQASKSKRPPKVVGGSTITQQLAKNLFLSGERTHLRKGQELLLTLMIETILSKERILEIYLNSVEWGEGIFGAEAAAQRYFKKPASALSAYEAARLAVMLPAPKRFEKLPNSAYLSGRAQTIVARMGDVELP
jgi:monofunctional glycosyltransferase